jgi:hypothetical protein
MRAAGSSNARQAMGRVMACGFEGSQIPIDAGE